MERDASGKRDWSLEWKGTPVANATGVSSGEGRQWPTRLPFRVERDASGKRAWHLLLRLWLERGMHVRQDGCLQTKPSVRVSKVKCWLRRGRGFSKHGICQQALCPLSAALAEASAALSWLL